MGDVQSIQTLLGFYIGTVIVNIFITSLQAFSQNSKLQKVVLLYWISVILSAGANVVMTQQGASDSASMVIAAIGTFVGQGLLSSSLLGSLNQSFKWKTPLIVFVVGAICSTILKHFGIDHSMPEAFATWSAAFPGLYGLFLAFHFLRRNPSVKTSAVQKMFVFTFLVLSLHFLDYPWFRLYPQLFFLGLSIAFILLHILSVLMPMMANENHLQNEKQKLEEIIQKRVEQLSVVKQKLWDANKFASLGRMAGGIAHEISTPLSLMTMHAQIILDENEQTSNNLEVKNSAEKIQSLVARSGAIVDSLRKVARDERGTNKQEVDINKAIEETLSFCYENFKKNQIEFKLVSTAYSKAWLNPVEFSQVLINLLSNAIDALAVNDDKIITLEVSETPTDFIISVTDSGKIDPSIANQVMDPFFTTKPIGKGTGLGLSISKTIIENHGGQLAVDTHSPTTRFYFNIPKQESRSEKS